MAEMRFSTLADYFSRLEQTSSRNEMTEILARLLVEAQGAQIEQICYLALGELAPPYRKVDFNVAEKLALRAIAEAFGVTETAARAAFKRTGDLGNVVYDLAAENTKSGQTVSDVFHSLEKIAFESGQGSVERKVTGLANLLTSVDRLGAKYLIRIPVGRLRLGFSDVTILDALSVMETGDKSARGRIERAYNIRADIGQIARAVKEGGLKNLDTLTMVPGIPIRAALAERLPTAEKIIEKMGTEGVLEPKIDGFRVQIHLDRNQTYRDVHPADELFADQSSDEPLVKIFSRSAEDTTAMFPDIVAEVRFLRGVTAAIFDGEAIALDPRTGEFLPFQETVQRKRKHDVRQKADALPLKVFIFDLLYHDGTALLDRPFRERRHRLEQILPKTSTHLEIVEQHSLESALQLRSLFEDYLSQGLEGIMIKKSDSLYQAGGRNFNWVKFKRTTEGNLIDTMDVMVMGYYRGRGKRQEFGLGAFLVGVRRSEEWVTVAKIGTGLSDDQWRHLYQLCQPLQVDSRPVEYQVDKNLAPDVWVAPGIVVEVMADEITRSPIHTCGFDPKKGSGLALRFPRLVRFREKKAQDATTQDEVAAMFAAQSVKKEGK